LKRPPTHGPLGVAAALNGNRLATRIGSKLKLRRLGPRGMPPASSTSASTQPDERDRGRASAA
jgi:hypothetical protein